MIYHGEWSTRELEKLSTLVGAELDAGKQVDWVEVAKALGVTIMWPLLYPALIFFHIDSPCSH